MIKDKKVNKKTSGKENNSNTNTEKLNKKKYSNNKKLIDNDYNLSKKSKRYVTNIKYGNIVVVLLLIIMIIIGSIFVPKIIKSVKNRNDYKESSTIVDEPKEEKKVKIIDINSKTRPYAIMINCHNAALPQSGLKDSYLVYEIMVEAGITRMMALFKDVDFNKVGSVRSARNQYLGYVFENDAIYVHAGGSPESLDRISNEKIADIDVDGQYGIRDKGLNRPWEHTLFTNTDKLSKAVNKMKLRNKTDKGNVLTYSADEIDLDKYGSKVEANKVSIKYSNYRTSIYEYNPDTTKYLRFMNSKKNSDLVTGEQYDVKNIIVYGVKYTTYTHSGYYGYQRLSNIGNGEGYYITDGYAIPITWEKTSESAKTIYKIKETGEDLVVNDGNTYIQIYPSNGGDLKIS